MTNTQDNGPHLTDMYTQGDECSLGRLPLSLQWRRNDRNGVSNYRRIDCSLIHLSRRKSKKTSKFRVTGLCEGNPPVTGGFPNGPVTRKMFPFDDVIIINAASVFLPQQIFFLWLSCYVVNTRSKYELIPCHEGCHRTADFFVTDGLGSSQRKRSMLKRYGTFSPQFSP